MCGYNKNDNTFFNFPEEWNLEMYSELNSLILKMLNPNPLERPNIFEIVKDPFFENKNNILSSSPINSIIISEGCNYNNLNLCPIVIQRVYNIESFNENVEYNSIWTKLNKYENNNEIKMLIMCMYESFENKLFSKNSLLRTLIIIVNLLTYRNVPNIFILSRDDINNILTYSFNINFNYINWNRFYGIYKKFEF